MPVRYPAPLGPGDLVGVTAPSSGVPADLWPRLEFCVEDLRRRGYDVLVGDCTAGEGIVSAPAVERAAELMGMLLDPRVRAVVPPWGGELLVEVLPHLDLEALRRAVPTWVVGFSDTSTLLLPLTTVAGMATVHGQNLLETPYEVPPPLAHWLDVVTLPAGASVVQGAPTAHRAHGFDPWQDDPTLTQYSFDSGGRWSLLDPSAGPLKVQGRLVGGCIETVSILASTAYGDLPAFARAHAPEGLLVYVEASGDVATDIARDLWRMRLAGWFDDARAVLVGRTTAPDADGFTQLDAVRSVLGDLGLPVVLDVDCGHVPPYLALVNGALAQLEVDGDVQRLTQTLV
jgi:muramoyltetrapeptide carboxypeptidase